MQVWGPSVLQAVYDMQDNLQVIEKISTQQDFCFFSFRPATTDITNITQLAIFVCGISDVFDKREKSLFIPAMHGTTKGEYLFGRLAVPANACATIICSCMK